jgi:hypothetical protein
MLDTLKFLTKSQLLLSHQLSTIPDPYIVVVSVVHRIGDVRVHQNEASSENLETLERNNERSDGVVRVRFLL